MILSLLSILALGTPAHADPSRCDKVKAEAAELQNFKPVACDESRETHESYMKAFPEAFELCKRLEARVAAGPVKLQLGTEDEMQREAMDLRQTHLTERNETTEHVIRELFPTPVDNNDASRIPPTVSSDCGTEIETHVRFRRNLLRGINEFYSRIEADDETLFQQASERALPKAVSAPVKNVR